MGPDLAEKNPEIIPETGEQIPGNMWLTRPLWGLADTPPYLHDGRAQTVEEAILWHGGEAQNSKRLYQQLTTQEQAKLRVFLLSLSREGTLLVE